MHVFKIKGIVLNILKNMKWENIITIFSEEYWKIKVQKKGKTKEKPLDIGYLFSCELTQKEDTDIYKIKNIKIKSSFDYHEKDYSMIVSYLDFIDTLYKNCPFWLQIREIFDIGEKINFKKEIRLQDIVLWKIKILQILWIKWYENDDEIVQKILKFIYHNKIEKVLKLEKIDNELLKKIREV